VQDLDEAISRKNQDCKASVSQPPSQSYQSRATSKSSQHQTDNRGKSIEKSILKSNPQTKCYKCQGYGHIAAKCASLHKIALINRDYP